MTPSLQGPIPPFPDHLRERDLRDRPTHISSAFSMSTVFPPGHLPPGLSSRPDHYPPSFSSPLRPPVSSPMAASSGPYPSPLGRPEASPGAYGALPRPGISPGSFHPTHGHRSSASSPSRHALTLPTFSPHSRSNSPFISPALPPNNSSLSDKLKMGFSDKSVHLPLPGSADKAAPQEK